jgi:hypothetical protein
MRFALTSLGLLLASSALWAQCYGPMPCPPRMAPDACGPGYYVVSPCGQPYGPNYYLRPGGLPFNGILPAPPWANNNNQGPGPGFTTHPYARSPRDYFMISDVQEDLMRRYR